MPEILKKSWSRMFSLLGRVGCCFFVMASHVQALYESIWASTYIWQRSMNQCYVGRIVSIYQWKRLINENLKFDTWQVMIFEITLKSPRVYRSYHEICNGLSAHIKVDFNTGCDIIQVGHFIPVHVILLIYCLDLHTCTQHWVWTNQCWHKTTSNRISRWWNDEKLFSGYTDPQYCTWMLA